VNIPPIRPIIIGIVMSPSTGNVIVKMTIAPTATAKRDTGM
jgi:hypothetical protein